ncbi:hypothetical protein HYH02_010454 [Chlamydomonas schloesseri]|uniref:Myosin motor domain-containing protein n=1 Tax=Chlamydomonas schloesseri TaxID=2026947 RepID=A0A835TLB4_9CHLO|nr:hypothetical protein HYH02_010454 [Chlamydomonas schloesseri]|eukprot:KAG2439820.1 hypothetical protein HYH02_010454 [Chlamydomonas schloesseri]
MALPVGARVWFPSGDGPTSEWLAGTTVSTAGEQVSVKRDNNGKVVEVDGASVHMANKEDVEDMTSLAFLHEPGVLWNLQSRYQGSDAIYTYTGNILIAVNPFKPLPNLYGPAVIERYRSQPAARGAGEVAVAARLPPHVYATACNAYRNMMAEGAGQAILVTGESGAGKTETAKLIMACLTHLGCHQSGRAAAGADGDSTSGMSGVEQKILESNPLLEAFGNAKTLRNNNSSRFGKYCEIFFDPVTGAVTGAAVRTYLLERSRVVAVNNPERSFHIFYQLVYGASEADRKAWRLPPAASGFAYLARSSCVELPGQSNAEEYQHTRRAMSHIGLSEAQQREVLALVAAVLHLGNIAFGDGEHASVGGGAEGAVVPPGAPQQALEAAAVLLGVSAAALAEALTTRQIQTPEGAITTPLSAQAAADSRDSLAKSLYARLFDWLVAAVNAAVDEAHNGPAAASAGAGPAGDRKHLSIGLLDIYGFESFEVNDLEQLCINLTNEKLQQHFNTHVFKWEQAEYEREGVDWSYISFRDNADVLELLEGRLGLMTLLDEACRLPKATAEGLAHKYSTTPAIAGSSRFTPLKRPVASFAVEHYAGSVTYSAANWLDKNRDYVVAEHAGLCAASSAPLVRELWAPEPEPAAGSNGAANGAAGGGGKQQSQFQFRSVSSVCRRQLAELMGALSALQPHYVRCIKPNPSGAAGQFNPGYSLQQLRCGGVMEAVRIACAGFAYRRPYAAFLEHFWQLCPEPVHALRRRLAEAPPPRRQPPAASQQQGGEQTQGSGLAAFEVSELRAAAEAVLRAAGQWAGGPGGAAAPPGSHLGHTKVFLRTTAAAAMERQRVAAVSAAAAVVQAHWRRLRQQRWYAALRQATVVIQAAARGLLARRLAERLRRERAACVIQRCWRSCVERMRFLRARKAAAVLQAAWRARTVRRDIEAIRVEAAALKIQTAWRAAAVRREYLGVLRYWRAAVKVQAAWRGFAARQLYLQILPLHRAALVCQRVWRAHRSGAMAAERLRQAVFQYWLWTKAAIIIQTLWRGKVARQRYTRLRLQQRKARILAAFGGAASAADMQRLPLRPSPDSRRGDSNRYTPASRPRGFYGPASAAKALAAGATGAGAAAAAASPGSVVRADDVALLPDRDSRMAKRLADLQEFKVSPLVDFWKAQEVTTQSRTDGGTSSQPSSRRGSGAHLLPRPSPSTFGGALPVGAASPSAAASSACAAELPSMPGSPPDTDFREAAAAIMHGSVSCRAGGGGGGNGGGGAGSHGAGGGSGSEEEGLSCEPSYGQLLESGAGGFGSVPAATSAATEVQAA